MEEPMVLKIKKLSQNAIIPTKKTDGAAGFDLCITNVNSKLTNSMIFSDNNGNIFLQPNQTIVFGTDLAIEIPEGFEGQIRSRSGLAIKYGLIVVNTPGTIDSDYRGEILVAIKNLSNTVAQFALGDRVAQLVINKVENHVMFTEVEELSSTERDADGIGSTGVSEEVQTQLEIK